MPFGDYPMWFVLLVVTFATTRSLGLLIFVGYAVHTALTARDEKVAGRAMRVLTILIRTFTLRPRR